MALILQQAAARLRAPDARRVVGRGGADDLVAAGLGGHLPDAIFVLVELAVVGPDDGRRLEAGHNATGLCFQLVTGLDFAAARRGEADFWFAFARRNVRFRFLCAGQSFTGARFTIAAGHERVDFLLYCWRCGGQQV